ncbi:RNA polymerase sigma factor [Nocardioides sp. LMS-CY]|uniref:RNA polymerase sigma factor n=1 Tax=Nocardioides sp. (strain LMS-CY) TaxID=2840457 RepID=UPI001C0033B8|nr:RNA polymerase sigma factor [Nocardioides sp. LMS-CY]QWF23528.1 RNA polymerase sigma factor [Nocardioides sp. LMS-CY]
MTETPTAAAITAVWRRESVRLVGALTRMTRDLDLAEDLAQDALVAALETWPDEGVPANPGAWLTAVAKRRAIDQFRRTDALRRRTTELARSGMDAHMTDLVDAVDHIEDDVLRLAFIGCHPALPPDSRTALTLRLVGGLTTAEIARAYLVKDATMGQRISRAKRILAESGASLEMPTGAARRERLADVLAVVYLIFTEGHAASGGADWIRPELCLEAMRLARILSGLVPDDPEVRGLQALLELQGSRLPARRDAAGTPVLLDDQDRRRWDQLLIRRGFAALAEAERLGRTGRPVGTYVVQASIAACHARARRPEDTDWVEIARLYDVLARTAPGPVVEVNRAVAHGRAHGPDAGLAVLDAVADDPALTRSHLPLAVRGDLLERAGRPAEAAAAFRAAAALTGNDDERALLTRRARGVADLPVPEC